MFGSSRRIEFCKNGFVVHKRHWIWLKSRYAVSWDLVTEIRAVMWDCFACHVFGYRFVLANGETACVMDLDLESEWEEFEIRLFEVFPEIDEAVVQEGKAGLPNEQELTCWSGRRD